MKTQPGQATDVAETMLCIADRNHILVDHLKLQKLLYFAQALSLVRHNKRLFRNRIFAWDHGPVVNMVYDQYKNHGREYLHCTNETAANSLSEKDIQVIEDTLETFKKYTGIELLKITHQHRPWKDVFKEDENKQITTTKIKEYYKQVLE